MNNSSYGEDCHTLFKEADNIKKKLIAIKAPMDDSEFWNVQFFFQVKCGLILVSYQEFALEKGIEKDLWNFGYRTAINQLQAKVNHRKGKSKENDVLNWFLNAASGFYIQLLNQICSKYTLDFSFRRKDSMVNSFGDFSIKPTKLSETVEANAKYLVQYCLIHLGDLARYRHQPKQAETYYRHAVTVNANIGHPYNQLALLETGRGNRLASVFLCIRALCADSPFPGAPANLIQTLNKVLSESKESSDGDTSYVRLTKEEYVNLYLKFHSILLLKNDTDACKKELTRLNTALSILVAASSFTRSSLVQMFAISAFTYDYFRGFIEINEENLKSEKFADTQNSEKTLELLEELIVSILSALLLPVHTMKDVDVVLSYPPLAAVNLILDWLSEEKKLNCEAMTKKRQIWSGFCTVLNFFSNEHFADVKKYSKLTPLPEDFEIEKYKPLLKITSKYNFNESSKISRSMPELRNKMRGKRLLETAEKFTSSRCPGGRFLKLKILKNGDKKFEPICRLETSLKDVIEFEKLALQSTLQNEKSSKNSSKSEKGILKTKNTKYECEILKTHETKQEKVKEINNKGDKGHDNTRTNSNKKENENKSVIKDFANKIEKGSEDKKINTDMDDLDRITEKLGKNNCANSDKNKVTSEFKSKNLVLGENTPLEKLKKNVCTKLEYETEGANQVNKTLLVDHAVKNSETLALSQSGSMSDTESLQSDRKNTLKNTLNEQEDCKKSGLFEKKSEFLGIIIEKNVNELEKIGQNLGLFEDFPQKIEKDAKKNVGKPPNLGKTKLPRTNVALQAILRKNSGQEGKQVTFKTPTPSVSPNPTPEKIQILNPRDKLYTPKSPVKMLLEPVNATLKTVDLSNAITEQSDDKKAGLIDFSKIISKPAFPEKKLDDPSSPVNKFSDGKFNTSPQGNKFGSGKKYSGNFAASRGLKGLDPFSPSWVQPENVSNHNVDPLSSLGMHQPSFNIQNPIDNFNTNRPIGYKYSMLNPNSKEFHFSPASVKNFDLFEANQAKENERRTLYEQYDPINQLRSNVALNSNPNSNNEAFGRMEPSNVPCSTFSSGDPETTAQIPFPKSTSSSSWWPSPPSVGNISTENSRNPPGFPANLGFKAGLAGSSDHNIKPGLEMPNSSVTGQNFGLLSDLGASDYGTRNLSSNQTPDIAASYFALGNSNSKNIVQQSQGHGLGSTYSLFGPLGGTVATAICQPEKSLNQLQQVPPNLNQSQSSMQNLNQSQQTSNLTQSHTSLQNLNQSQLSLQNLNQSQLNLQNLNHSQLSLEQNLQAQQSIWSGPSPLQRLLEQKKYSSNR